MILERLFTAAIENPRTIHPTNSDTDNIQDLAQAEKTGRRNTDAVSLAIVLKSMAAFTTTTTNQMQRNQIILANKVKISYDNEVDALYLELGDEKYCKT